MLNSRHLGALIPAVVFTCLSLPVSVLAAEYTLTDLGTLDGDNESCGYGINASGQITGESGTRQGTSLIDGRAFLYDGSGMQNLGTLGGSDSSGDDINDSGQVVGWSYVASSTVPHAFLYNGMASSTLSAFIRNLPKVNWASASLGKNLTSRSASATPLSNCPLN